MRLLQLILLSLFLICISFVTAHSNKKEVGLKSVTCWYKYNDANQIDCYHFFTHENPRDDQSRIIQIPLVVFKSERTPKKEDPILYIQGGPGQAYISEDNIFYTYKQFSNEYWLKDRDVILADFRGLGISKPSLVCKSIDIDSLSVKVAHDWYSVYEKCYRELLNTGLDLSQYHANNIVKDLIAIREGLNIRKWNLWGVSYGGLIAMLLADRDSDATRTIIADSPVPPRFRSDEFANIQYFEKILDQLFKDCKVTQWCKNSYPKAKEKFENLLSKLHDQPFTIILNFKNVDYQVEITDEWFLNIVYFSLYTYRGKSFLPSLVQEVSNGNYEEFIKEFKVFHEWSSLPAFSRGGLTTFSCNETEPINLLHLKSLGFPQWLMRWLSVDDYCKFWISNQKISMFKNKKVSYDTPILFLSGLYDYITPHQWTKEILNDFSNGQRILFPKKAHVVEDNYCTDMFKDLFINAPLEKLTIDQC